MNQLDFTRNKVNIDNILDVVTQVQKDAGVEVSIKESKYDKMGMKLNADKYYADDKESTSLSNNNDLQCGGGCSGCKSKCSSRKVDPDIDVWSPEYKLMKEGIDDDDLEEEDVICDYCRRIGYSLKYIPEICDNCNDCESCGKYAREECEGCRYSIWRDGTRYGEKISMEEILSKHEMDIINELSSEDRELVQERFTSTGFSVRKK